MAEQFKTDDSVRDRDARSYESMLKRKALAVAPCGIRNPPELSSRPFDFQRAVTNWAIRRGRSALFLDTGLGKTTCEIEWANAVSNHTNKPVLILTPLAVAEQFVAEGQTMDREVTIVRSAGDVVEGINVCNYEMMHALDPTVFGGVVLDESSILKNFNGKTRNQLIECFAETRFKLCGTATPAPNDHTELGNHAEFLGVMSRVEMLSMFFTHDGASTQEWRLKGHAQSDFWEWVASWAMCVKKPDDIGFDGSAYDLPPLVIHQEIVKSASDASREKGMLLGYRATTLNEMRSARRGSLDARVKRCADMVSAHDRKAIVWCELNDESSALSSAIAGSVEVKGADPTERKLQNINEFLRGDARVLVTKPSICGMGLNMQICHDQYFVGLGYSWEQYYQAIRRSWRFGQMHQVDAWVITSDIEGAVVDAIQRKQDDADAMAGGMVEHMKTSMRAELGATGKTFVDYNPTQEMVTPKWLLKCSHKNTAKTGTPITQTALM